MHENTITLRMTGAAFEAALSSSERNKLIEKEKVFKERSRLEWEKLGEGEANSES